ncbi:tyrosine-type recombinase/integrase [Catenuloplanes indicus]|uniref:Integrase n=1 Tax=Catenuloplanes indicus TaxID=137267 RepID=A0AAE4AZK3_9ACTN|nr:site-specific integrase [Catenuloplanes indicus]MDQ0366048.1 integrase [Catenuloplanes indicus]
MAHIEDRWFNTIDGPDGKPKRVKSNRHGVGLRYRVRYIGPNGREASKSFPDRAKKDAEAFLVTIESDKLRGSYIDPKAGQIKFQDYAEDWLRTRAMDESSRESTEQRVRKHLYPYFGDRQLGAIKPAHVREWDQSLKSALAASTRSVIFTHLSSILSAAVDDRRLAENPCSAKSVTKPRATPRRVVPWTGSQVSAIRDGLPVRYKPIVDLGGGCGLRQGEIFGFSPDNIDFADGWISVVRQVKKVRSRLVFGLPKNDKDRRVPLAGSVADALRQHMDSRPPLTVTLPWEDPNSADRVSVPLVFFTDRKHAIDRANFDQKIWRPAVASAGITPSRATGMHALRHLFASALLDGGETIKALAEYLGHADPGFTLRVYTHLMPDSETGRGRPSTTCSRRPETPGRSSDGPRPGISRV